MFNAPKAVKSYEKSIAKQIIPAKVIDNNDPKKLQRVKIRIANLHYGVLDTDLPWSLPIINCPSGMGSGIGAVNIPSIGTNVAVFFPEDQDADSYYIGGIPDATNALNALYANYPYAYGWVDAGGNVFIVDTTNNSIFTIQGGTGNFYGMDSSSFSVYHSSAINMKAPSINMSGSANFDSPITTNTGSNGATSLSSKTSGNKYTAPNVANNSTY